MLQAITRRLKRGKRGISTVIVVMLSLVLIVIIVGNVVLWSYQMNQLDWEKMREDIAIVNAAPTRDIWSYNPSQYVLKGSTSWLSGNLSNLTSDDGVYMSFRSYYSGTDTSDFVDNNTSNVDSNDGIGTHSNFPAQQYGPDLINDTLTEADTKGYTLNDWVDSNTSNVDGLTGHGTSSNFTAQQYTDTINDTLTEENTGGTIMHEYYNTGDDDGGGGAWASFKLCQTFNSSTSFNITSVKLLLYRIGDPKTVTVSIYATTDSPAYPTGSALTSGTTNGTTLTTNTAGEWREITLTTHTLQASTTYAIVISISGGSGTNDNVHWRCDTTSPTYAGGMYGRSSSSGAWGTTYMDNSRDDMFEVWGTSDNYELDYEFRWTSANYTSDNEELCIRTGPLSAETLGVDAWNGASWTNIIVSLSANTWNNVSVATYLTNGTITFRYLGGTESGDTVQSTWQIESALLHTWNNSNYRLDIEEQFQNVDNTTVYSNKELCIFAGTWSTSETIKVDVWNTTSSSWVNVIASLTKNAWNNVSIANLLTATVTIRFTDGTPSSDTVQDSWSIDATLLHAWSNEYIAEVEFIGSSNTENWNRLNWTVNSAWTTSSVNVTLQLYNYALGGYPTSGNGYIVYTSDSTPSTDENKSQTINMNPTDFRNATGYWKMKVKGAKADAAPFDFKVDLIEFKTDKDGEPLFTFKNEGSLTLHLVSLWIDNSTYHQRYDINIFINSGDTASHTYSNVILPDKPYNVKVITERGNTAVFASD